MCTDCKMFFGDVQKELMDPNNQVMLNKMYIDCLKQIQWVAPVDIHTPPVEEFENVYHKWSVNFQMHVIPSVWSLD